MAATGLKATVRSLALVVCSHAQRVFPFCFSWSALTLHSLFLFLPLCYLPTFNKCKIPLSFALTLSNFLFRSTKTWEKSLKGVPALQN